MAKSGRKKHLGFSPFRSRQQAADNRRLSITWINRMVNEQVEKRIAELRSEFLLMKHALREEMAVELQEQLRELVLEGAGERSLHYILLDREQRRISRWLRKMDEEHRDKSEDDEEPQSLDLETLSFNDSVTTSDSNSIYIMMKPPKRGIERCSRILFYVSSEDDTSDADTSGGCDTSDADTSSQPAKCEQGGNQPISSDGATVAGTSKFMKKSEKEESSRNPFHANPSFIRRKKEIVQVDRTKEEEALLMERQWREWMDKQEMRGHHKVKPIGRKNTEKQGEAARPVSEKQMEQDVNGGNTIKKIKTYLSDLLNPHKSHKWERLEDED